MPTFREMCDGKMSVALRAMCDGLRESLNRTDFRVNMGVWVGLAGDVCLGCAASCAVQKLTGERYTLEALVENDAARPVVGSSIRGNMMPKLRARVMNVEAEDLEYFELAIDRVRQGSLRELVNYMGVRREYARRGLPLLGCWDLRSDDWLEQLPMIERFVEYLESKGV